MASRPYTIRIFVPDGDPEGVRVIDRMNWTGHGITFPRGKWPQTRQRPEFSRPGVYILIGYGTQGDDLPTIYVGEGDVIRDRLEQHYIRKEFWDRAIAFTASNNSLNKAHVQWLEYALVKRAAAAKRSHLDNGNTPGAPGLSEAELADVDAFLVEILQILPLVALHAFEDIKPVVVPVSQTSTLGPAPSAVVATSFALSTNDTIVVPAQQEGFERVFLGENCWYAIRISGGMLPNIKYIAAYRTKPESQITHYAPVHHIEPYGEDGKYRLVFASPAVPIGPIPLADAPPASMRSPRYTSIEKLKTATKLTDLFPERDQT